MMKILILLKIIALMPIIVMAQIPAKDKAKKAEEALILTLKKNEVPVADLQEKYKYRHQTGLFGLEKVSQKLVLSNGDTVKFKTTDDKKVKALLTKLYSISAVDFLLELRGIEGSITIPSRNSSWVKREDIPALLKLAKIDIVTPMIKQYIPSKNKKVVQELMYVKTPMAINALNLIYSHIASRFPTAGSLTPTYESVQAWYESGKPKESYKLVLFSPTIPDIVHPKEEKTNK